VKGKQFQMDSENADRALRPANMTLEEPKGSTIEVESGQNPNITIVQIKSQNIPSKRKQPSSAK